MPLDIVYIHHYIDQFFLLGKTFFFLQGDKFAV